MSEQERAQITANMNRRIRSNGLAPKEFVLKRSLSDHKPITVQDNEEGERQFERREQANAKQLIRDQVSKQLPDIPDLKKGDLVYIIADLSKSRAREQYLVSKCFLKNGERWILVRKCQKGFRNVEYLLKASEVMKAPVTVKEFLDVSMDEEECSGFQQNVSLAARNKLKQVIKDMEAAAGPETKKRGRPPKPVYPDYLHPLPTDIFISDNDERLIGFETSEVESAKEKKVHLDGLVSQLEEDDNFQGYTDSEINKAIDNKVHFDQILHQIDLKLVKIRKSSVSAQNPVYKHAWDYETWLAILEDDM